MGTYVAVGAAFDARGSGGAEGGQGESDDGVEAHGGGNDWVEEAGENGRFQMEIGVLL